MCAATAERHKMSGCMCGFIREEKLRGAVPTGIIPLQRNDIPAVSQLIPSPPDAKIYSSEFILQRSSASRLKNGELNWTK